MQQASGGERGGGGGVIEASMCARYAMYSVKEFFFFWVYQVHISNLVFFLTKSNNTTFFIYLSIGPDWAHNIFGLLFGGKEDKCALLQHVPLPDYFCFRSHGFLIYENPRLF